MNGCNVFSQHFVNSQISYYSNVVISEAELCFFRIGACQGCVCPWREIQWKLQEFCDRIPFPNFQSDFPGDLSVGREWTTTRYAVSTTQKFVCLSSDQAAHFSHEWSLLVQDFCQQFMTMSTFVFVYRLHSLMFTLRTQETSKTIIHLSLICNRVTIIAQLHATDYLIPPWLIAVNLLDLFSREIVALCSLKSQKGPEYICTVKL